MAQLSGMPNQPFAVVSVEKVAPTSATEGSPHFSRISHVPDVAAKSPSASAISMMWPKAFSARGLAASICSAFAARVVGQHHVDLAVDAVRLDVLGPIHLGRAEQVGGEPRLDQHVGLALEAVLRRQRALAVDERHPRQRAVLGELRDVERAGVEKVHVGGAVVGIEGAARHELVDVVEALVVAEIEDDASVLRHDQLGAFVLEAAERGALLRHRIRVHRIDLDDPAEAVRLVRLLADVEAVVDSFAHS